MTGGPGGVGDGGGGNGSSQVAGPVRRPAVAGSFYTADPKRLADEVAAMLVVESPQAAIGVVVPHAGYMYSGHVAGRVFGRVAACARVVVLAVNHRGNGARLASWASGRWETPLGEVPVDEELLAAISRHAPLVRHDPRAHAGEHSLEVQIPFLQALVGVDLRIAPLSIASHDLDELETLGLAVAEAVRQVGEPVLLVASTDFTHYQPAEVARLKDGLAIERIQAVDGPGLLHTVLTRHISMCGVGPTTATLVAARDLGAREGVLVCYASSGDVTGDSSSVVGYAGLILQ